MLAVCLFVCCYFAKEDLLNDSDFISDQATFIEAATIFEQFSECLVQLFSSSLHQQTANLARKDLEGVAGLVREWFRENTSFFPKELIVTVRNNELRLDTCSVDTRAKKFNEIRFCEMIVMIAYSAILKKVQKKSESYTRNTADTTL